MEKKKPVSPRIYWNLTSNISVCCTSDGLFLCHLSKSDCSKHVSENYRNSKIFVGNNFRRH